MSDTQHWQIEILQAGQWEHRENGGDALSTARNRARTFAVQHKCSSRIMQSEKMDDGTWSDWVELERYRFEPMGYKGRARRDKASV